MGNSGSVHNLQNNGVHSEINAYTTQQYLKRTAGEPKNKKYHPQLQHTSSYNEDELRAFSADRQLKSTFKVLPQPTESLKLKATTNGAILHAGGTISCRPKDTINNRPVSVSLDREEDPTFYSIRRSHTLIIDGHRESMSKRESTPPLTEFRRSQTILHVAYNRTQSQENSSPKLGDRKSSSSQKMEHGTGTILKMNKYNKKRKAPPAPTTNTTDGSNTTLALESKEACLVKPRMYATNSNKSGNAVQQLQPRLRQTSAVPFQRGSHLRNSANAQLWERSNECCLNNKHLYRREKSFDAVLLSPKVIHDFYDRTPLPQIKNEQEREREREQQLKHVKINNEEDQRQTIDSSRGKKFSRKPLRRAPNKIPSTPNDVDNPSSVFPLNARINETSLKDRTAQEKLSAHDLKASKTKHDHDNYQKDKNVAAPEAEKKTKVQPTRIPQLKRTFYFGMESTKNTAQYNKPKSNCTVQMAKPVPNCLTKDEKKKEEQEEEEHLNLHRHSLEVDEEIDDNGILVHVRPTLPRRQPETPTFSPSAAWRNLFEEQQHLEHARTRLKNYVFGNNLVESPICLISTTKDNTTSTPITWTPQQDLGDEDEEELCEKDKQNEQNHSSLKSDSRPEKRSSANALHIFSLSLPRDVHLQGQFKTSLDCTETSAPGLKAANGWMVPGFNSLQKFKTTITGGVNSSRLNSKCSCPKRGNNSQPDNIFQTIFGETFATDPYTHGPDCELYKTQLQSTSSSHNENWVLHKSKLNDSSLQTSHKNSASSLLLANRNSLVCIQPKSLTHVCGGKHVMYLPGQESCNIAHQSSATLKRQRQQMARESLQDPSPVQDIQKSNARTPEKNTPRFSFQSTVRVLEKRRLAEKLSKDAEIQEAQRLNELEAMKRVEEDFQRKRAQDKANIRNQLRLHLNANIDHEDYRSLPLNINDRYENPQQQSDTNNNISCRAEPDGAVSPSPLLNDNLDKAKNYNFPMSFTNATEMRRFDSDYEESEIETQLADFQRTALLLEPYLQSII